MGGMKKRFKQYLKTLFSTSVKSLKKTVEGYDYISFDVYDTLICRVTKNPEEVFELMQEEPYVKEEFPHNDFLEVRKKAASMAVKRKNSINITLDDIYREIGDITTADSNRVKEIELKVEESVSFASEAMLEFYNWCRDSNKTIIIISEMYLPHEFIERILNENGFTGYERIYVSGEQGSSKKENLYQIALDSLGITPSDIIHVGDSWQNDYVSANKNGIKCKLINQSRLTRNFPLKEVSMNGEQDCISRLVSYEYSESKTPYYVFGFSCIGPLMMGFCRWIHDKSIEEKCDELHFLSREGLLPYRVYKMLYPDENDKCEYLPLSRDSINVTLKEKDGRSILLEYLEERNVKDKSALVDIGWREVCRVY
ncbi:MAG: HAD hydrolase-like protein [Lachnospiraceae bacterium]|nr:HAD hydrolase-like protein [Lachnospiraceae bacterium]